MTAPRRVPSEVALDDWGRDLEREALEDEAEAREDAADHEDAAQYDED
jgi:hypothetical protein